MIEDYWRLRANEEVIRFAATGDCRTAAEQQAARVAGDIIGRRMESELSMLRALGRMTASWVDSYRPVAVAA